MRLFEGTRPALRGHGRTCAPAAPSAPAAADLLDFFSVDLSASFGWFTTTSSAREKEAQDAASHEDTFALRDYLRWGKTRKTERLRVRRGGVKGAPWMNSYFCLLRT